MLDKNSKKKEIDAKKEIEINIQAFQQDLEGACPTCGEKWSTREFGESLLEYDSRKISR